MIPIVNVTGSWETILEGTVREELERAVLPGFLRAQRWFGGKGRHIEAVRVKDWGRLPVAEKRVFAVFLEVFFAGGKSDDYFLLLGVCRAEDAAPLLQSPSPQEWQMAHLTGLAGEGFLYDALADDDTCLSLITAVGVGQEFATCHGRIRAFPTTAFTALAGPDAASLSVERGPAKSSNSLLIYGHRLLLKLFRRLEPGVNPEWEIGRFLTESSLFQRIPRLAGAIEYQRSNSEPITLAILQSFVAHQGDGWQHALERLRDYYQRVDYSNPIAPDKRSLLQLAETVPPPAVREAIDDYLNAASTLGQRTAEMHRALSAERNNPAFAPELFTPQDANALRSSIQARQENALDALSDNLDRLPREVAASARQLLEKMKGKRNGGSIRNISLGVLTQLPSCSFKIRCHGDYHLGQVLRVGDDYVIIDFEGEPMRTLAERRAKQSPLKDVAGMIRSYHNAAYAGLFDFSQGQPEKFARLRPWAELWYQWVSAAFLRTYRAGFHFVPADTAAFAQLLDAFLVEKMFYELHYELNNRPDWVRIPLHHILTSSFREME